MKSQHPKLLVASDIWPWPMKNGFTLRSFKLLEELQKYWDISLIAPSRDGETHSEPVQVKERIVTPRCDPNSNIVKSSDEAMTSAILDAIRKDRPNVILLWGVERFSYLCDVTTLPPIVSDLVDGLSLTYWKEFRSKLPLRQRVSAFIGVLKSAMYERRITRLYKAVTVVGDTDARAVRMVTQRSNIKVISNGVDLQEVQRMKREDVPAIVFSGVMEYPPNIDAAIYFAKDIFPRIYKEIPSAEFWIVGHSPVKEIVDLESLPGVRVLGSVSDMAETLRKCAVSVAPMRQGAGVKNKILEAWAVGLPVVMTEYASNGLNVEPENRSLIISDPIRMAHITISLLKDSVTSQRIGLLAREHASLHHSWNKMGTQFNDVLVAAMRDFR